MHPVVLSNSSFQSNCYLIQFAFHLRKKNQFKLALHTDAGYRKIDLKDGAMPIFSWMAKVIETNTTSAILRGIVSYRSLTHSCTCQMQECCICLCPYEDGAELRELPCNHHFHCTCIDKWLHINATCPLCKFNIIKSNLGPEDVQVSQDEQSVEGLICSSCVLQLWVPSGVSMGYR